MTTRDKQLLMQLANDATNRAALELFCEAQSQYHRAQEHDYLLRNAHEEAYQHALRADVYDQFPAALRAQAERPSDD